MKKIIFIGLLLLASALFSLDFKVESCTLDPSDQSNASGEIVDANYDPCSVLLVETDVQPELYISGVDVIKKENIAKGKYYFYVSYRKPYITFGAEGFKPYTYKIPIRMESGRSYKLILKTIGVDTRNQISVMISTTPSEARIFLDGREVGLSGKTIQVDKGKYFLKIIKEGYSQVEKEVTFDDNNIHQSFALTELDPQIVVIKSDPPGAEVYINGEQKENTPCNIFLTSGKYDLIISKSGYVNSEEILNIQDNKSNDYNISLIESYAYLNVKMNPSDAEILINKVSYKNQERIKLKPGLHRIIVRKTGYQDLIETIDLELKQELNKTFTLQDNYGTLKLKIDPKDALVMINDIGYPADKPINLAPGEYSLVIMKNGFGSTVEKITIDLGKVIEKSYKLNKQFGKLKFTVNQSNCKVSMKQDGKLFKSWQGNTQLENVPVGRYELWLEAQGGRPQRDSVTITDNQETERIINLDVKKEILVKGGSFAMGLVRNPDTKEWDSYKAKVSSFYMDQYEVTLGEFRKFIDSTGYVTDMQMALKDPEDKKKKYYGDDWGHSWRGTGYDQEDDHPVSWISWFDAIYYCNWKSKVQGLKPCYTIIEGKVTCDFSAEGYRLPTEAEFQYAMMGGKEVKQRYYSGGKSHYDLSWSSSNSKGTTHPIGTLAPNELGFYDLSGNISEWCWDWFGYYPIGLKVDPRGPDFGVERVVRGGSYAEESSQGFIEVRNSRAPDLANYSIGFRLCRTPK